MSWFDTNEYKICNLNILIPQVVDPAHPPMNINPKNKIKGKIGTFSLKDKKVVQELEIYKVGKNKFTKF